MDKIGIIAGAGRMPFLVARGIAAAGSEPVIAALDGFASPRLEGEVSDDKYFRRVGVTRMGQWIRHFKRNGITRAVMIGSVSKRDMYCRNRILKYFPDLRTVLIWYLKVRGDKRDAALLLAAADELAGEGITLVSNTEYCGDNVATLGVMTKGQPPAGVKLDIEFGWKIARASADLDIGQALAVKEHDIIAVEAIEGTDAMIARAGELCHSGGWTLIKVARTDQDMRFDVPTIGPKTIRNLNAAGCKCIVVEAEKTMIADKTDTLELADKLGISVVGHCHDILK